MNKLFRTRPSYLATTRVARCLGMYQPSYFNYKSRFTRAVPSVGLCAACFLADGEFSDKPRTMARSLARYQGSHLLAVFVSGLILASNVVRAYNITRKDDVRSFHRKHTDWPRRKTVFQLAVYVFFASRPRADANNGPDIGDRTSRAGRRT